MSRGATIRILKRLRDGGPATLKRIASELGLNIAPPRGTDQPEDAGPRVAQLAQAGLVKVAGKGGAAALVEIDPRWVYIQSALGISLSELEKKASGRGIFVSPIFREDSEAPPREPVDVFVAMPFEPDMLPIYELIRSVVLSCGFRIARA